MSTLSHRLTLTRNFLIKQSKLRPKVALVLGSGLSSLADAVADGVVIPYKDIPHFPMTSVAGHKGRLIFGRIAKTPVLIFDGRVHFYEGLSMQQVAYPVYVAKTLGAATLIATNAAGGINERFAPGDLMLIRDHINFTGDSPLRGPNLPELGTRFPNMRNAYDPELLELARKVAGQRGIALREGVYVAVAGPTYETEAELRMLQSFGADAVGMSTVPEVIAARHSGLKALGLSVIANSASPVSGIGVEVSHDEVQSAVALVVSQVRALLEGVIEGIAD
ncbi:MAG: purine-nucleoside phosphorylase [Candidatus Eremiobacteraeota bacterium]|nr:purine-nucleoside phosphorylase [Candidatus Eremiobacteraeota bacterium]